MIYMKTVLFDLFQGSYYIQALNVCVS